MKRRLLLLVLVVAACDSSGGTPTDDGPAVDTGDMTGAPPLDLTGAPPRDLSGMQGKPDLPFVTFCTSDSSCNPPATVCNLLNSKCAPGCTQDPAQCFARQTCNAATGHCAQPPGTCTVDLDCGDKEFCTHAGACQALPTPGAVKCIAGAELSVQCNMMGSASSFQSCAGSAHGTSCPYCRDGSCYWPLSWAGPACKSDSDCHANDKCNGGLCVVDTSHDPCVKYATVQDIMAGKYGAGKEVCIRDVVEADILEPDGDHHVRFGSVMYPGQTFVGFVTEPTPQYFQQLKLMTPFRGLTYRAHGMVRWDEGHQWWELHPVDFFGM